MSVAWFWAKVPDKMTSRTREAWRTCLPGYKRQENHADKDDCKLLAHALMQYALKRERHILPAADDWAKDEYGKPVLFRCPQIQVSLSHSGKLAFCAVSDTAVGVDVQKQKDVSNALIKRVCTEEELRWLSGQEEREFAFAQLWARKESYGKALGVGLAGGLKSVSVFSCEHTKTDLYRKGAFTDCSPLPFYAASLFAKEPALKPVQIDPLLWTLHKV